MVEGADFLSFHIVWFVLAGFILGFATSTLWEWLYYRRKRLARLAQTSEGMFQEPRANHLLGAADEAPAEETDDPWKVAYRSSGVYLESEQTPLPGNAQSTPAMPSHQGAQQNTAPTALAAEGERPRINPSTLATLESIVTQLPIVHSPAVRLASSAQTHNVPAPGNVITATHVPVRAPAVVEQTDRNHTQPAKEGSVDVALPAAPPTAAEDARDQATPSAATGAAHQAAETQSSAPALPVAIANTGAAMQETNHPDNLALIKGVGEAYKRRLYSAGIYTWRQVAESEVETLRRITRAKPNADISGWRQRARDLAEQHHRWEATFQGPLDDLTRIEGIGAITADTLYKAGICTYEQLAAALPDELAQIVPAPTVGDEIDFDGWINSAVRLANAKRRNQELLS